MRVFVLRPLAFVVAGLAAGVAHPLLAQDGSAASANASTVAEEPDEVTVRGRKTMTQYRLELERARENIFRIFNEANEGKDTDIQCRAEQPTGSRMRQTVCRSEAELRASAEAGRNMLNALFTSTQGFNTNARLGGGGSVAPPARSLIGSGNAQEAGKIGERSALAAFEEEWKRVIGDNRDLFRAVTEYAELENEYALARGDAPPNELAQEAVVLEEASATAQPNAPVCEASTLTEFQQRNNIARVSGKVSISMCPAGTTGSFTLVARVRDDAGEIKPIEFKETWQRADAEDHSFSADYPIGDNVELMSVRVRGLECTCAAAAP